MLLIIKHLAPLLNVNTFLGVGAFSVCLLFPLTPTPANSSDMARGLSLQAQQSKDLTQSQTSVSAHSYEILAALTIYLEAQGESFAGKMAVAAVIRNRMNHKYHSDGTVSGTVLRAKQFEPWIGRSPGEIRFNPNKSKNAGELIGLGTCTRWAKCGGRGRTFLQSHVSCRTQMGPGLSTSRHNWGA